MGIDPSPVETVTFDSFSTLVDVDSTARAVEEYVEEPVEFAREWHTRAANYGMVANHIDAYATYYQLHRDALEYLFAERDLEISDDELDAITDVYHEMAAFDDVYDGCYRLADAGYDLGVISNGDPPLLESLVRVTGIGEFLSATVSADEIERHKPGPADIEPMEEEEPEETISDEDIERDIEEAMSDVDITWGGVEKHEGTALSLNIDEDSIDTSGLDVEADRVVSKSSTDDQVQGLRALKGGEKKTQKSTSTVDDQTSKLTELKQRKKEEQAKAAEAAETDAKNGILSKFKRFLGIS
jgi:2-haloalkanoic acid dehalogenase type II